MLVVGLTGNIGSGKTTVANFFAKLNVPVIDADIIAKELLVNNSSLISVVVEYFGNAILNREGGIDRQRLRQLIFNHPAQKKWLENLLHPLIIEEIQQQLDSLKTRYCIVVIPLLIETGPYAFIQRILVVTAPREKCLERAYLRDQSPLVELQKIFDSQAKMAEHLAKADEVIDNHGDLEQLKKQVQQLHDHYLYLSKTV